MGSSSSAANAANAANTQRQNGINNAVSQINTAYGSPQRAQQVANYGTSLQHYYDTQANTQEANNARNLKFAMARSGQTGGSQAVASNAQLNTDYTNALLQASQQAQGGMAALQQSDINAKNQMIGLAEQGAYTGAIPQQVAQGQSASLNAAQNYGTTNALGNIFAGTSAIASNEATQAAQRAGQNNPIGGVYGTNSASNSTWGK